MRKAVLYILLLTHLILPSCSKQSNGTSVVVKPKTYHRWYDRKKDKRAPRVKKVRMKS